MSQNKGSKSFQCPKCDRVFAKKYNLQCHLKRKTPCDKAKVPTKSVSKCPFCKRSFASMTKKQVYNHKYHCKKKSQPSIDTINTDNAGGEDVSQNTLLFAQSNGELLQRLLSQLEHLQKEKQKDPRITIQQTNDTTINIQNNVTIFFPEPTKYGTVPPLTESIDEQVKLLYDSKEHTYYAPTLKDMTVRAITNHCVPNKIIQKTTNNKVMIRKNTNNEFEEMDESYVKDILNRSAYNTIDEVISYISMGNDGKKVPSELYPQNNPGMNEHEQTICYESITHT